MSAKPTAAPWKLTIEPTHIPDLFRAGIEPAEGPYRGSIAYLQNVDWDGGIGPNEMTANAHLLVAAPELYEALDGALEWMSCVEGHLRDGEPFKRNLAEYRAALAKARGQA